MLGEEQQEQSNERGHLYDAGRGTARTVKWTRSHSHNTEEEREEQKEKSSEREHIHDAKNEQLKRENIVMTLGKEQSNEAKWSQMNSQMKPNEQSIGRNPIHDRKEEQPNA